MRKVLLYNGGMKVAGKSGVGRAMEHQARALEVRGYLIPLIRRRIMR